MAVTGAAVRVITGLVTANPLIGVFSGAVAGPVIVKGGEYLGTAIGVLSRLGAKWDKEAGPS